MNVPKKEIRVGQTDALSRISKYAVLFICLSVIVMILQGIFLLFAKSKGIKLNITEIISAVAVFCVSFIFILNQGLQILKYKKLTKAIEKHGVAEDINALYMFAKNNLLGRVIRFFQYVMLLIVLVLCFYFATYSIFDFSYNGVVNMYLPIIVLLTVTTGFSVKYMECLTEIAD